VGALIGKTQRLPLAFRTMGPLDQDVSTGVNALAPGTSWRWIAARSLRGRQSCRAYVQACVLEDDAPTPAAMAASRHTIGGERFVEETERRLAIRRSGRAVDPDLDLPQTTVPIEPIDETVAAHYGVMPPDLESCRACGGAAKRWSWPVA